MPVDFFGLRLSSSAFIENEMKLVYDLSFCLWNWLFVGLLLVLHEIIFSLGISG